MGILASVGPSGSAPLPGFLNSLAGPLDHYGYWAIALLLLLENIGIPVVPGELSLIAGAIFAGSGRAGMNIVVVGVIAVVAASVGAEIGYLIGRFAGRELILRYGRYVLIKPHHLDRAQAIVDRFGGIVVIVARFIVGLREANGIIAGIAQMRLLTFTVYNVVGACLWVATWVTIGDVAGDHIDTIYADINRFSLYVLIALAVLLVCYVTWRVLRRRLHPAGDSVAGETQEISATHERSELPEEVEAQDTSGIQKDTGTDAGGLSETQATSKNQEIPASQDAPGNHGGPLGQEGTRAQDGSGMAEGPGPQSS
jgi:membrane protein DedA with SNARE-associated domain